MFSMKKQAIRIGKSLDCGCCGQYFKVWEGYEDQDQDQGYGICQSCQGEAETRVDSTLDRGVAILKENLGPKNLKDFLSYDKEKQRYFAAKAIAEGVIGWKIS